MPAATAATLPSVMATSRTALILFRESMTCPPFSSRSYLCGACRAGRLTIAASTRHTPAANVAISLIVLPSPVVVPFRGPFRRQVLAHVERSGHRVAGDRARETETQRISVAFGVGARELRAAAVDRAREIARHEVPLVRAFDAAADLLQMQRMGRRACDV